MCNVTPVYIQRRRIDTIMVIVHDEEYVIKHIFWGFEEEVYNMHTYMKFSIGDLPNVLSFISEESLF